MRAGPELRFRPRVMARALSAGGEERAVLGQLRRERRTGDSRARLEPWTGDCLPLTWCDLSDLGRKCLEHSVIDRYLDVAPKLGRDRRVVNDDLSARCYVG